MTTHPATPSTDGINISGSIELHNDPINTIRWVPVEDLDPNAWNPNRVHKAELRLLERSLLSTGWIQPILANREGLIIDGFHRWRLSQDSKAVRERYRGRVPVAYLDVDRPTAMLMTIRINRAKGTHVAVEMSSIVRELLAVHHLDPAEIAQEMGATLDEVNLLAQDGVFAVKGIADWSYSPAWYPAETRTDKIVKAPQAARKVPRKGSATKKSTTRRAPRAK